MDKLILKKLLVEVPYECQLEDLNIFTPEEKYIILKTGVDCLKQSKSLLSQISEKEMYDNISADFLSKSESLKEETEQKEKELILEREIMKRYKEDEENRIETEINKALKYKLDSYERLQTAKDNDITNLNNILLQREKELIQIKEELRVKELDIKNQIDSGVMDRIKLDRESQDNKIKETLTKTNEVLDTISLNNSTKTSTEIGIIGEKIFGDIAERAFQDFDGFELLDVHKQAHKGDWHINIKDLTIMVDSKSYKRKVDITQRDKIKNDLRKNEHINFAWLVSLNTKIDKVDNANFVFDWISEKQCVIYINNLLGMECPEMMIKTIYYLCKNEYARIVNSNLDSIEITKMRESHYILKDKITLLRKRAKEIKVSINGLKNLHDGLENDIINLLSEDSNNIINKYYDKVMEWWGKNIINKDDSKLKSTNIWTRFKKDNDDIVKELDANTFKDILCAFLPENDIIKAKGKSGALEINNIDWSEGSVIIVTTK